jgi:NAD(P)-dependent dehydrogenase (short-subunit alcohol dehydrogenase family)
MRLKDKVAVVTGGTRGIGEAIALAFAREGARVAICSRKPAGVQAAVERINAQVPGQVMGVVCHVGQEAQVEELFEQVCERWEAPHVLVNNAGTNPYFGPLIKAPGAAWDKTFEVNLKGPFYSSRAFALRRIATDSPAGSILCVSSIMGMRAAPFQGVYGMTKAALISMVQSLAFELAETGIRVNAIAPGFVDTKLASAISAHPGLRKLVIDHTPQKRVAGPEEITGAALYLASDESRFTTGQTLVVDGGYTIC